MKCIHLYIDKMMNLIRLQRKKSLVSQTDVTHGFQNKAEDLSPAEEAKEQTCLQMNRQRRDGRSRLASRWIGKQKYE